MPRTHPRPRRRNQPVKAGLKGFAEARKTPNDLLRDVRSHVVAQEAKHGDDHREDRKIHVSELVKGGCPRMMFYKVAGEVPSDPRPPAYHQLVSIWSSGTAEHEKWQRWLKEMGDLWGTWYCLQCKHSWLDQSPAACEKCGGVLLRYDEVNLEDPEYPLVGHADGAVPRLDSLVEIKSFSAGSVRVENARLVAEHTHKVGGRSIIDQEGLWKAVKRPLRSHLVQGLMYLWLCKRMGLPYTKIIFIYENKTTQATKTFEVTLQERHVKVYFDILDRVVEAVDEGVAPPRPVLFRPDGKPCTECPFRSVCWSEGDTGSQAPAVSAGGQVSGDEETGRETEVRSSGPAREGDPSRSRRHHRTGRPGTDEPHDRDDPVGRASRDAVGARRSRRAVGGSGDGEGESPRFARRKR